MGDIFDEVTAMEEASAESTADTSGEANFNAAELEDIMAEIDSLEKDFAAEVEAPAPVAAAPIAPAPITEAPMVETAEVLSFEKKPTPVAITSHTSEKSNVCLTAEGSMALNLTFKIGNENATLVIDQEKGLLVTFSGVELSLHAEKGCTVMMDSGVSFSVPVKTEKTTSIKKSA